MTLILKNINLPKLNKDQTDFLDPPLTPFELHNTLNKMPNIKAPRPDGFPPELFKHFWKHLSLLFLRIVSNIKHNATIPPSINTAIISELIKPNKDPT